MISKFILKNRSKDCEMRKTIPKNDVYSSSDEIIAATYHGAKEASNEI